MVNPMIAADSPLELEQPVTTCEADLTPAEAYREWFPGVWRTLLLRGLGEQDAYDVAQETFEAMLRSWNSFQHRSQRKTWFYTILFRVSRKRRNAIDHYRSTWGTTEPDELSTEVVPGADNPEQATMRNQQLQLLAELLETLTEKERSMVELVKLNGLSQREAGTVLGLSKRMTYKVHDRALRKLHAALRRSEAHDEWKLR